MNRDPMQHVPHIDSHQNSEPKPFWQTRYALGLVVMGAVAAYFLLSEHRAHFIGALPFLLLLACPLMHVFMHHGHGGHGGGHDHAHHHGDEQSSTTSATRPTPSTGDQP